MNRPLAYAGLAFVWLGVIALFVAGGLFAHRLDQIQMVNHGTEASYCTIDNPEASEENQSPECSGFARSGFMVVGACILGIPGFIWAQRQTWAVIQQVASGT